MLSAERHVHFVVGSNVSFSMVHSSWLPRAVLSSFPGLGKEGCTSFPILSQRRFRHTSKRVRKTKWLGPLQLVPNKSNVHGTFKERHGTFKERHETFKDRRGILKDIHRTFKERHKTFKDRRGILKDIHGTRKERQDRTKDQIIKLILRAVKNHPEFASEGDYATFADRLSSKVLSWRGGEAPPIYKSLYEAYIRKGLGKMNDMINYLYQQSLLDQSFSKSEVEDQSKLADFRYPLEWYPGARILQRSIHLHVGPTNSGKTYNALKSLEKAKSGIYAGPLRLLAHEIFTTLNSKGIACNLITGDDRQIMEGENIAMTSCTVEMTPTNGSVDVAVVDEIQMIGDPNRGWAWTQALLGLKAKELHLCGEERAVPLIRELAALMGDKLEIHRYERLSPLKTMTSSLNGDLKNLRKGDCLVAFSRVEIHALKKEIEKATRKSVAVIYGSLPPEIRTQQARLFNDPDNDFDFLVASDAIGMGLNLSIKRIIFETSWKFNGQQWQQISSPHLKQIAGRAGRYRVATQPGKASMLPIISTQNLGLVTSFEKADLQYVKQAMESAPEPIMTAGILPPTIIVSRFATLFPPSYPFSYILRRLHDLALMHPRFHLCGLHDQIRVADIIEPVKNLTTRDRITFCASPASSSDPRMPKVVTAFALCVANNSGGALLELPCLKLKILEASVNVDKTYLVELEFLHWTLVLYLWLSYRFDGVFTSQEMAVYVKGLVETRIDKILGEYSMRLRLPRTLKAHRPEVKPIDNERKSWHMDPTAESDSPQAPNVDPNQFWHDGSTQSLAGEIEMLKRILDEKPQDNRVRVRA